MQVNQENFNEARADIKAKLTKAKLIAVDLEFTGCKVGGESDSYLDSVADRENKLCLIAEGYTISQLGLTIGYTSDSAEVLELASYNILLAPEGVFVMDAESLKFIRENNGDLNLWIDKGVRNKRRQPSNQQLLIDLQAATRNTAFVCNASRLRARRREGFDFNAWVDTADMSQEDAAQFYRECDETPSEDSLRDFWKMLHDANVPLVVHGQLDILFLLHEATQQQLPSNLPELAKLIQASFPKGVYDTSYLHEALPEFRLTPGNLKDFFGIVQKRVFERIPPHRLHRLAPGVTEEHYGEALAGTAESSSLQHEAGFDSLMTVLLFLYLRQLNQKGVESSANRLALHRCVDCFDVQSAAQGSPHRRVYGDDVNLLVAIPKNADDVEKTTERINHVRRASRGSIFYRRLDETDSKVKTGALLVVVNNSNQRDYQQITEQLIKLGVSVRQFSDWQRRGREMRFKAGYQATAARDENQVFHGRIKSFKEDTGYGFIESAQAVAVFGSGDVYVAKQQLGDCVVGDDVSFMVTQSKKDGRPQAQGLQRTVPTMPPGVFVQQALVEARRPGLVAAEPVMTGRVKSYSSSRGPGSGYGFIKADGERQDIYVCGAQLIGRSGLAVDEMVQFTLVGKGTDRPQAHQVRVMPGTGTNAGVKGKGKSKGKSGGIVRGLPESTGETFVGRIKSLSDKYGFIECQDIKARYNGDCFSLRAYLGTCKVGDTVEFDVGVTPDNKPQALAVRPSSGVAAILQYKAERSVEDRASMCASTCTESISMCGKSEDGVSSEDSPDVVAQHEADVSCNRTTFQ